MLELVKAGGRFQRMSDGIARRAAGLPAAQLVAALRDNADHPWKPPGGGYEGALTHDVMHRLDMTRALGIDRDFPAETMRAVLDTRQIWADRFDRLDDHLAAIQHEPLSAAAGCPAGPQVHGDRHPSDERPGHVPHPRSPGRLQDQPRPLRDLPGRPDRPALTRT